MGGDIGTQGRHLAGGDDCAFGIFLAGGDACAPGHWLLTRTMVADPAELGFELFYYHEVVVFFALLEE